MRPIDTTGFKPTTLRDQPAPALHWVQLADLVVDDRYQRELTSKGRGLIQRIANDWDWTKYQPILVAATVSGGFAIVDGQHRAHAAAVTGLAALPAMIVPMTPVQQAEAFRAVNSDRVRLSAAQMFKAKLAAGDALAMQSVEIVNAAGCELATYVPSYNLRKIGTVYTFALVQRMVAAGEGEAVTVGLRAVLDSDSGKADRKVWDHAVLSAWLPALAKSQRFLRLPDLPEIFDEIDWDGEFAIARRFCRMNGGSVRPRVAQIVEGMLREAVEREL